MSTKYRNRLKLATAAGVAGLMVTGAGAATLKSSEDCPADASAAGALKTIAAAQTDYNSAPAHKKAAKRAHKIRTKKKAAKKKAAKKAVKKAAKKAAKRASRRPC